MVGIRIYVCNDQVQFAAKNTKPEFIACEPSVKGVVTFGVVLYRNQRPIELNFPYAELHIGSFIRYKNIGNYFLKCDISQKNFNILQLFF